MRILSNIEAADLIPHNLYDKAQIVLVTGKRGQGKTTLISRYIEKREPRIFMLDPHNDFPQVPEAATLTEALTDLQVYDRACWRRLVPKFGTLGREARFDLGEEVFAAVNRYLRNCLVIYNEATLWTGPKANPDLQDQITQGRRIGIRHIIDCQRFQLLPDVMRSEGTELCVFRTTRYADREVISREADPETAQIAQTLPPHQCVLIDL